MQISYELSLQSRSQRPRSFWSEDGDRDLWPGPTPEVRDSRTSRHSAHAQSQVWQIWLVLVSIYCVYKAIQNPNVVGPGQGYRFPAHDKRDPWWRGWCLFKRSTSKSFRVTFQSTEWKKVSVSVSLEVVHLSSHAHKTGSWYLIGFLFKISVECPGHFHMGVSPPEIPPKRSWKFITFWELETISTVSRQCRMLTHNWTHCSKTICI